MTRRRSGEREGLSRWKAARRIIGICTLAGIGMIASTRAEDLTGRVILSEQSFSSDGIENQFFDQLYELRFTRQVTDPFTYLLFFRGEQANGHSTVEGETNA